MVLYARGFFNTPKHPDIRGLDKFKGRVLHTARWDKAYTKEQWAQHRVAVIGSGASSIQVVTSVQPYVKQLDVFVRMGVWFVPISKDFTHNHIYTEEEKKSFHHNLENLIQHA